MSRSLLVRAVSLGFVSCAIPIGALALSAAPALATAGEPVIVSESVSNITEHSARLEAQIDPEGLETTYAFWLGHEVCTSPAVGYEKQCYISVTGPLSEANIAPGAAEAVSAVVTALEANEPYLYVVGAVNSAGHVLAAEKQFRTLAPGGLKTEGTPLPPPENKPTPFEIPVEPWVGKTAGEGAARELAKAEEERKAREAANQSPAVVPIPKGEWCGEPGVTCESTEVTLAGTSIALQGNVALVRLECQGEEHCGGKLALTAKTDSKRKAPKHPVRTIMLATAPFSIPPAKTATIDLELNAAGRTLLSADRGRLNASLTVLRSYPAPSQTATSNVHLLRRKLH